MSGEFLDFMQGLADAAGRAIMPFYRAGLAPHDKAAAGPFDPVTIADRTAEAVMREMIGARYPRHGIIGEEFGREHEDAALVWVLDPIDGTKAFLSGVPTWGILIGLLQDGAPLLGMLDQPFLQERFWGDGLTATMRNAKGERNLQSRADCGLAEAMVWASSSFTSNRDAQQRLEVLRPQVRMLRYGNDCYGAAMLAAGHIDVIIETGLEIYDIAANIPIITGAGGVITAMDGGSALRAGHFVASGNPVVHAAVLDCLNAPD